MRNALPASRYNWAMRIASALVVIGLTTGGCVTGAGVWKHDQVSLPLLAGAVAADLVVTGLVASQVQDFTTVGSIGTAVAVTAVDFTVGCFLGACSSLRL